MRCIKIAVQSCGTYAQKLCRSIRKTTSCMAQVTCFIDSDSCMHGKWILGVPVISLFEARRTEGAQFDLILIPTNINDEISNETLRQEFLQLGFRATQILWVPIQMALGDSPFSLEACIPLMEYNYLDYLEYKVCDHCNLGCRGCSHFANLVGRPVFRDFQECQKDLRQLKQLIPHIGKIRLLGGEPFLHPQLQHFAMEFRRIYPYSDIRICTNGLLLAEQTDAQLDIFAENHIGVDITCYPVLAPQIDRLVARLKKKQVFVYVETRQSFKPVLLPKATDGGPVSLAYCNDVNLYEGKLSPCPIALTIGYFNAYFNNNYPTENTMIELSEPNLTGPEVLRRLRQPLPLCAYCINWRNDYPVHPWQRTASSPSEKDWMPI